MVWIIVGNYGERMVVMRALSRATGSSVPLAYKQKKRFENLEAHKEICISEGRPLFWYSYLRFVYRYGLRIAVGFIAFAGLGLVLG